MFNDFMVEKNKPASTDYESRDTVTQEFQTSSSRVFEFEFELLEFLLDEILL